MGTNEFMGVIGRAVTIKYKDGDKIKSLRGVLKGENEQFLQLRLQDGTPMWINKSEISRMTTNEE